VRIANACPTPSTEILLFSTFWFEKINQVDHNINVRQHKELALQLLYTGLSSHLFSGFPVRT
jgi:hypothetical protein